jgi:DNA-binding FadR family transcriptional regulator
MNNVHHDQDDKSSGIKPGYNTVEKLKSLIASEEFTPGSRLPSERELISRFKITRANLRKAFDILEREGLIWRHVGKGTFIAEPDAEKSILSISELVNELTPVQLLRARLSIEPAIAREAAIHASEADVSRIDTARSAASGATSWPEYERADDLLHHEIASAAQNPLLMSMFEYLNAVRRAVSWNKVVRRSDGPASDHDSFAEHNRIFAAIEERNANEAQAAMRKHLISVSKRLFGDD